MEARGATVQSLLVVIFARRERLSIDHSMISRVHSMIREAIARLRAEKAFRCKYIHRVGNRLHEGRREGPGLFQFFQRRNEHIQMLEGSLPIGEAKRKGNLSRPSFRLRAIIRHFTCHWLQPSVKTLKYMGAGKITLTIVEGTGGIGIVSNDDVFPTIEAHRERNTCFFLCVRCKYGLFRGLEEICYERYRD